MRFPVVGGRQLFADDFIDHTPLDRRIQGKRQAGRAITPSNSVSRLEVIARTLLPY
jgi:hypothetical protein